VLFFAYCFHLQISAQACLGNITCEKECAYGHIGDICCQLGDRGCTPGNIVVRSSSCADVTGACDGALLSACGAGETAKNHCTVDYPYHCYACKGTTCSYTGYNTSCVDGCDSTNANSCINACNGASETTCGSSVSCLCNACAGATNCKTTPGCTGQCCEPIACIEANTQASADCGGWYGCRFSPPSYTGANGTTCPTGGNAPAICLGGQLRSRLI